MFLLPSCHFIANNSCRKKYLEHQAEVNRLMALRKFRKSQVSQPPPSLNTLRYRTFRAPVKTPEAKNQQYFFPDSFQVDAAVGAAMMMMDDTELDRDLAKLREGTVEVKMS